VRTGTVFSVDQAPSEFVTQQEVAERFRVSSSAVSRWRREGFLPGVKIAGTVRYRREDVDRIAASGIPAEPKAQAS
jgi:excisionase family DNA binding protein